MRKAVALPMLTRVAVLVGVLILTQLPVALVSAQQQSIKILLTSPTIDEFYANVTSVPQALGYFAAEGLTVSFANVAGGSVGGQIVSSGKEDVYFGTSDSVFKARQVGGDLKIVYVMSNNLQYYPVVPISSPIKTLSQLKGKRLGVLSLSMGGIVFYREMLADVGLDPDKDVSLIAVGQGAQALAALNSGTVDALGEWDAEYAAEEATGIRFRKLLPPNFDRDVNNGISSSIVTSQAYLSSHSDVLRRYLRAVAKATVFCLHNEAACVRIHWAVYPDMKPQDADTPTGLQNAVHVLEVRYASYDYRRYPGIHRWGDTTDQRVMNTVKRLQKNGEVTNVGAVSDYFARQLLDFANTFNGQAIIRQAETYKGP